MQLNLNTYIAKNSPIHALDARVKLVLLAAYSVLLFLIDTWAGMALCALAFAFVLIASKITARSVFKIVIPIYVLVALTLIFNSFVLDVNQTSNFVRDVPALFPNAAKTTSTTGFISSLPSVAIIGNFGFVPAGFVRGCFFALRILLLVFASLIISFTSTSTELVAALTSFLQPLRRLRVPVDDIATIFSLTLRFIPVTAQEFFRVKDAQEARCAPFSQGSAFKRLRSYTSVFVPLFVGMFRRAESLSCAMDARCYGVCDTQKTSLCALKLTSRALVILIVGLVFCTALAIFC